MNDPALGSTNFKNFNKNLFIYKIPRYSTIHSSVCLEDRRVQNTHASGKLLSQAFIYPCMFVYPTRLSSSREETISLTPVYPSPRTMSDSHSGEYSLGAFRAKWVNEWEGAWMSTWSALPPSDTGSPLKAGSAPHKHCWYDVQNS